MKGLLRRDIAFLMKLRGRSCFVITDESPWPPGQPHSSQIHVGHFTLTWMRDDGELDKHCIAVFFAESSASKEMLIAFATAMDRLRSVSSALRRGGHLGRPLSVQRPTQSHHIEHNSTFQDPCIPVDLQY